MKYFLPVIFFLFSFTSFAKNENQFEAEIEPIAYHIYLSQMISMPKSAKSSHLCKVLGGDSIFGQSTKEIKASTREERIKSSLALAGKIEKIAKAFRFSTRFDIGYWLGILHKESQFCLNICGGYNCKDLSSKFEKMNGLNPPYADLGIGQLNFETFKDFINYRFKKYESGFEMLAQNGFFSKYSWNESSDIREYFKKLLPNKAKPQSQNRSDAKKLYSILMKDESVNLAFSLPIFLEKIAGGINIDNYKDKNSRLAKYQNSSKYRKFSNNFYDNFEDIPRSQAMIWKRSFGALTYNGHRKYALDYAVDVYCLKSLHDSFMLRDEETTLYYVYGKDDAPFKEFKDDGITLKLSKCKSILQAKEKKEIIVGGQAQSIIKQSEFGKGKVAKVPSPTIIKPVLKRPIINNLVILEHKDDVIKLGEKLYLSNLTQASIEDLVQGHCYESYCDTVEDIGKEGRMFFYSFLRKILYPQVAYEFNEQDYEALTQVIYELNPFLAFSGNEIMEEMTITFPILWNIGQAQGSRFLKEVSNPPETRFEQKGSFKCENEGDFLGERCYKSKEKLKEIFQKYQETRLFYSVVTSGDLKVFRVYKERGKND